MSDKPEYGEKSTDTSAALFDIERPDVDAVFVGGKKDPGSQEAPYKHARPETPSSVRNFLSWVGATALATVVLAAASLIVLLVVGIWRGVL